MRLSTFLTVCAKKNERTQNKRGFSLPELIIVIAIFAIISSIAMFNQGKLSSNVLLTNMAYEVGLAIREAQVYGIGVRSEDPSGTAFNGQFGAHFDINNDKQIIVFADQNADGLYDSGEERYMYEFENRRGNRVSALCVGDLGGSPCTASIGQNQVNILFRRPNPSNLVSCTNTSVCPPELQSNRAYVVLTDTYGDNCRVVVTEPTGQIRVEDSTKGNCASGSPTP